MDGRRLLPVVVVVVHPDEPVGNLALHCSTLVLVSRQLSARADLMASGAAPSTKQGLATAASAAAGVVVAASSALAASHSSLVLVAPGLSLLLDLGLGKSAPLILL